MQDICIPEGIGGRRKKEAPGTFGVNVPGAEATCCYLITILVVGQHMLCKFGTAKMGIIFGMAKEKAGKLFPP